jgi:hypothetical protein
MVPRRLPKPRLVTGILLAGGSVAGSILVRRRAARRREHVDLYVEDGSMLSLAEDAPEAPRILAIARELVDSAQ